MASISTHYRSLTSKIRELYDTLSSLDEKNKLLTYLSFENGKIIYPPETNKEFVGLFSKSKEEQASTILGRYAGALKEEIKRKSSEQDLEGIVKK